MRPGFLIGRPLNAYCVISSILLIMVYISALMVFLLSLLFRTPIGPVVLMIDVLLVATVFSLVPT